MDQFLSRSRRDDWRWRRFAVSERILFATFSYTVPNLPDELLNPPVNTQNDRVWAKGKKKEVASTRLLIEWEKFAPHLMVSAGACYGGKGRLHLQKRRSVQTIIPPSCCQTWWKTSDVSYPANLSFSKTGPQLTQQLWHRTGLAVIVQISFERMNGHPTHQI